MESYYLNQLYYENNLEADFKYEIDLLTNTNNQLREEGEHKWFNTLNIIDACLFTHNSNETPSELVNQVCELFDKGVEYEFKDLNSYAEKIIHRLQKHLSNNESNFGIYAPERKRAYFIKGGFNPIECPRKTYKLFVIKHKTEQNSNDGKGKISLLETTKVRLDLSLGPNKYLGDDNLKDEYLTSYINLKHLEINFAKINNFEFLKNFKFLEEVYILSSRIECFNLSIDLPPIIKLDFLNCKFENFNIIDQIHLKYLRLEECKIEILTRNCFANIVNLEELNLSWNKNLRLEEGCFNGLRNLKRLNLSSCRISKLNKDFLVECENLLFLDLSDNQEVVFEKDCLNGLFQLKELNLSRCYILELENDFFFGFESLEILDLSRNHKMRLKECWFNDLNQLKKLNLSRCCILELRENFFLKLNRLEILDLSFNCNVLLQIGCFNGLNRLKQLYLSDCNILILNENLFLGLNCLKTLDLSYNRNMLIRDHCFNGLNRSIANIFI